MAVKLLVTVARVLVVIAKAVAMGVSAVESCSWWRWSLAMCREVAMQDGKRAPDRGAVGVHEHR